MVTRYYICDACDYRFVIEQPMHEKLKKRCPECKRHKLYQDLSGVFVGDSSPKTLGGLAAKKRDKMGVYERQAKDKEYRDNKQKAKLESLKVQGKLPHNATEIPEHKPWYNPEGESRIKKITKMNQQQKKDYILHGKE